MSTDLKATLATALKTAAVIEDNPPEPKHEAPKLHPLARSYVAQGVESVTRLPSPNLKNETFRATLLHWRAVVLASLAVTQNTASAFTVAVQALASSEGALQAKRLIDNVMGQVLWTATVDIDRAIAAESRTSGDVEQDLRERLGAYANEELRQDAHSAPWGLDPERDPDAVEPPTEDEAIEALECANAWLSMIADLLPVDDNERLYLGLGDGLAYTQRRTTSDIDGTDLWISVHSVSEAIELQREKNKVSFAARTARQIASHKQTFEAIARLAA